MPHILIIDARFYEDVADMLYDGAVAELEAAGASHERISVPGAFEIPAAISMAIASGKYDGYIALGCVIRGETSHYDYVCGENARGINQLAMEHKVAIGYGVLTVENKEQAIVRANVVQKNKGGAVARACLEMIAIKEKLND